MHELLLDTCPATSSAVVSNATSKSDSQDNHSSKATLEAQELAQTLV